jgi:hypothetical protein
MQTKPETLESVTTRTWGGDALVFEADGSIDLAADRRISIPSLTVEFVQQRIEQFRERCADNGVVLPDGAAQLSGWLPRARSAAGDRRACAVARPGAVQRIFARHAGEGVGRARAVARAHDARGTVCIAFNNYDNNNNDDNDEADDDGAAISHAASKV